MPAGASRHGESLLSRHAEHLVYYSKLLGRFLPPYRSQVEYGQERMSRFYTLGV